MVEELMDRLINAVDNLREETQRHNENVGGLQFQGSRVNRQSTQSTESEMRRLYPSINSIRTNVNVAGNNSNNNNNNSAPDRNYVESIRNFQPSTITDPRKERKTCVKRESGLLALAMKKIHPKRNLFCEMSCFYHHPL